MKTAPGKIALFLLAASIIAASGGCALFHRDVKSKYVSARTDVFVEPAPPSEPPEGSADIEIKAAIKKRIGGTQYPFVVNIDGQAAIWDAAGSEERLPVTESAEGGTGMRYSIDRTLRLSEGRHHIFFAVPEEDYSMEFDVELKGGKVYLVEFVPLYRYSPTREHIRSFNYGIYRYDAVIKGKR